MTIGRVHRTPTAAVVVVKISPVECSPVTFDNDETLFETVKTMLPNVCPVIRHWRVPESDNLRRNNVNYLADENAHACGIESKKNSLVPVTLTLVNL